MQSALHIQAVHTKGSLIVLTATTIQHLYTAAINMHTVLATTMHIMTVQYAAVFHFATWYIPVAVETQLVSLLHFLSTPLSLPT